MATVGLLETEVRYIAAEGTDVVTSLAEVDAERVVKGLPVRDVRSFARQKHYSGLFWSATTGSARQV